jgi:Fur family ferric uptake transcriptional regulator
MGIVRKTKSVETLLQIMEESHMAISVVDLIERLKHKMNKTTVYRILDRLEQDGIVHSFLGQGGLKWYARCKECPSDVHIDAHPHFQCQECGKAVCLDIDFRVPVLSNYKIESAQLLLTGQCEECQRKTKSIQLSH